MGLREDSLQGNNLSERTVLLFEILLAVTANTLLGRTEKRVNKKQLRKDYSISQHS